MKLKTLFFLCLVLFCFRLYAINEVKGDSLYNVAEKYVYQQNWLKAADHYIMASKCFYDNSNLSFSYVNCIYGAGCSYFNNQQYSDAIRYLVESFQLGQKITINRSEFYKLEPKIVRLIIVSYNRLYFNKSVDDKLYTTIKYYCDYYLNKYRNINDLEESSNSNESYDYLNIVNASCQFALDNNMWIDCIEFAEQGLDFIYFYLYRVAGPDIFLDPSITTPMGLCLIADGISSSKIGCYNNLKEFMDFNSRIYIESLNGSRNDYTINPEMIAGVCVMFLDYANVYHGLKEFDKEKEILDLVSSLADENPNYVNSDQRLILYYYKTRYELIVKGGECTNILESFFPKCRNPHIKLECSNYICQHYMLLKDYRRAYDCVKNMADSILASNEGSVQYQKFYTQKAECEIRLGKYSEAKRTILNYNQYLTNQIKTDFPRLVSYNRQEYLESFGYWFSHSLPYFSTLLSDESINSACYNGILLYRNALLESDASLLRMARTSIDPTIEYELSEINNIKRKKLLYPEEYDDPIEQFQFYYNFALNRREKKAIDLTNRYEKSISEFMNVKWSDIKERLGDDEIAIEFLNIKSDNGENIIYALALKKGYTSPHLIELCKESDLQKLDIGSFLSVAYNKIWYPLASELAGVKNIFFSVDGILHILPVEYAIMPNGETVNQKYKCTRLSSTRNLISAQKRKHDYHNAILIGDIDYNASFDKISDHIRALDDNNQDYYDIEFLPTIESNYDSKSSMVHNTWNDLNSDEISYVKRIMGKRGINMKSFSSYEASEDLVKKLSFRNTDILHFSTHGLFVSPSEKQKYPYLDFINSTNNPMNCSMLVMAGVNNLIKNGRKSNYVCDGLLLASDIADLNLNDIKLVVLSTCDSGLGSISSEGVWGLQRGFKQAGCKSIVMSLSEVDVDATAFFMKSFYDHLLNGKSVQEALNAAQNDLKASEEFNEPQYWAPFIALDPN